MRAEQLEAALSSADIETRREAVVEAGQSRNRALAKPLLSALGDSDWRVREEAVRAVRDVAVEYDLLHGLIAGVAQGHNVGLRNAAREVLRALGSAAAHALVAALSEVEPTARKFLVEALACGGAEEAIDALVRAVRGDDALIAVSAMDALAQLGGERAVAALREKLRAPEPFERAAALDALLRLDVVLSWSELEPFLEDRVLRRVALPALGRSGDERALPYLVAALSEKSTHLASRALVGLQRLYMLGGTLRGALTRALASLAPDVRQRVRGFARDDDSAVAFAACLTLACARDPETLGLAVELCSRGVPASELALALSSWGEEAIVLLARLASGNGGARVAAIDIASELCVLRRPGASTAALLGDAVRDALGDHESWVRRAGLRALPRFVEARDAMVLVVHAQREEAELAQLAGAALRVLAERERDAVRDALAQSTMTGSAASVLAELAVEVGVVDTLGRLREALLSDEAQTRVAALSGLSRVGGSEAGELVTLALADDSPAVQMAALEALSRMPRVGQRAVDPLVGFETSDPEVEAALAHALGSLDDAGDERVRMRLRKLARSGSPGARLFAIAGLTRLQDPALDELLTLALADSDTEIVKQAVIALAEAGGSRAGARLAVALSHPAWDVRRLAAVWIARLRATDAEAALRGQLAREGDEYVRVALRDAIASLEAR